MNSLGYENNKESHAFSAVTIFYDDKHCAVMADDYDDSGYIFIHCFNVLYECKTVKLKLTWNNFPQNPDMWVIFNLTRNHVYCQHIIQKISNQQT